MNYLQDEINNIQSLVYKFDEYRDRIETGTLNFEPPAFLCIELEAALRFRLNELQQRLTDELQEAEKTKKTVIQNGLYLFQQI